MTQQAIKKAFSYSISCYVLIVIALTIYWVNNYSKYARFKGDDSIIFAEYLLILTVIFYLIQLAFIRQIKYLLLLIVPFFTMLTSIILGLGVMTILAIEETPRQTICIYSIVYSLTNILFSLFILTFLTKGRREQINMTYKIP